MLYILISYQYNLLDNLIKRISVKNIDWGLTYATSKEVIDRINIELQQHDIVCINTREHGAIEIDCSKLKGNNNSKVIFYRYNGNTEVKIINCNYDDGILKLNNFFGALIELTYNKEFIFSKKWYVSNII